MQSDKARLDLEYALTLNKRQWLAHYALGLLDYQEHDFSSAITHFDQAHQLSIHRPEIFYYRAVAHYQAGDDKKAVEDMHRAIQLFRPGDKRRKDAEAWLKEFQASLKSRLPGSST